MAKVTGPKTYGPYKGSKQNGGRSIVVKYDPKSQKTTSTNAARDKKEKELLFNLFLISVNDSLIFNILLFYFV